MTCFSIMKCGDNEPGSKLKVQKKKYKNQEQSKHGRQQKLEAGSGAIEVWASSAYRSPDVCSLSYSENEKKKSAGK